ncbi:Uu.00g082530.m01.CDS01 [Anthostomella pinea]|uniref:Uu.00g082530.m01.CDS01 n=1 Tax=Anthostomella pinea TaxID=933095 RepID=A0AAI8YJJ3_9PEZI|nr:Uu.00g082530.m01.CDS01 [Anthostomella pinea]
MSYWDATGPALAAYTELLPGILDLLAEKQGPIPNSDLLWFSIYMIGSSCDRALPHIMFAGAQRPHRKKAVQIIKHSDLLHDYPGMYVGEWPEAPHIGRQTQRTSRTALPKISGASGTVRQPEKVTVEAIFSNKDQQSALIRFQYRGITIWATSSMYFDMSGLRQLLVPAHVLFSKNEKQSMEDDSTSDRSEEDYEFGGFPSGDEEGQRIDPLATSAGSLTSSDSRSSDPESPDGESLVSEDSTAAIQSSGKREALSEPSKMAEFPSQLNGFPIVSADLDYALWAERRPQHDKYRFGLQEMLPANLIVPENTWATVKVLTSHGMLTGRLLRSCTYVRLPNSSSFTEVYSTLLDSEILPGDCGAMVYDEHGVSVYGHIITGSSSSAAFVVPAEIVYRDILRRALKLPTSSAPASKSLHPIDEYPVQDTREAQQSRIIDDSESSIASVGLRLGGTSLINANVFMEADKEILSTDEWPPEIRKDGDGLQKYYDKVAPMLELQEYPQDWPELPKMELLRQQAEYLNMGSKFRKVRQTTRFENGPNSSGVEMSPSRLSEEAKGRNGYLVYFASHKIGPGDTYSSADLLWVYAKRAVFFGAGSIGTSEILWRSKAMGMDISDLVGHNISDNGDNVAIG